jgi:Cu(I)/Ag(I) efflux system membrane fusion protein
MKRAAALFLLVVAIVALAACRGEQHAEDELWTCPMHPQIVAKEPGSCPICNMDLVKQESALAPSAHAGATAVSVVAPQVATVVAEERRSPRTVRAAGRVVADERRVVRVESRLAGWIAELDADFVGDAVRRGGRIALLDSPDLYAAESDYLVARESARRLLASNLPEVRRGADDLVFAARRRLELLNVPDARIAELERTRVARRTIEIPSPASGVVSEKLVVRGQRVEPGTPLVVLVDLSTVWVEADLYEADGALARRGQRASLTLPADPSLEVETAVSWLAPELDAATRTLRARFDVPNRDGRLRPGMFVDVTLELGELAGVAVPDAAVLATGERALVFVAGADGHFTAREVEILGRQAGETYLRAGLAAGERVAAEASFLLDSESRLRTGPTAQAPATEAPATSGADPGTHP